MAEIVGMLLLKAGYSKARVASFIADKLEHLDAMGIEQALEMFMHYR
jgi:hypothetical protein